MTKTMFDAREFLTKKEVALLMRRGEKTVQNLIVAGKLEVVRGRTHFDGVKIITASVAAYFGPALDGLTFDPETPVIVPDVQIAPQYEDDHLPPGGGNIPTVVDPVEQQRQSDLDFAARYKAGEVPDSMGNYISGRNDRFPSGMTSLIGNAEHHKPAPAELQSHMDPALLGEGPSEEKHEEHMREWRRRGGGLSMAQQFSRSQRIILAAFPKAERT
jgi:hypothetical protein